MHELPNPLPTQRYRAIPEPTQDVRSLQNTVMALKEVVEELTLQRKSADPPVYWSDLIRMGIATRKDHRWPWERVERNDRV